MTPEQHAENERKTRYTMACIGDEDAVKSYEAELAALRARVAELEGDDVAQRRAIDTLVTQRDAARRDLEAATCFVFGASITAMIHISKTPGKAVCWRVYHAGGTTHVDVTTRDAALAEARRLADAPSAIPREKGPRSS